MFFLFCEVWASLDNPSIWNNYKNDSRYQWTPRMPLIIYYNVAVRKSNSDTDKRKREALKKGHRLIRVTHYDVYETKTPRTNLNSNRLIIIVADVCCGYPISIDRLRGWKLMIPFHGYVMIDEWHCNLRAKNNQKFFGWKKKTTGIVHNCYVVPLFYE